jgi:hypothetical protein
MVLWPHLDEFYGRFRRRFPACDLLAKFVVDALGMAACELRAELGEVRETVDTDVVDIERAILAGTLFLIGKLVGDFEIKRARLITRVDLVDPDQLDGVSAPAADSTVSLRAPLEAGPAGTEPPALALLRTLVTDPRLLRALVVALESPRTEAEPAQPRCSPSGSPLPFQSLPGSFRVAELARVLDFEHEFRFVDAGYDRHGAKLVAVAIRLPSA